MSRETTPDTAPHIRRAIVDFAPAPCTVMRHDGWSADRQRRFILALLNFGNVAPAARAVSASATGAYRLRRRPGSEGFAAAWDRALDEARMRQFMMLMDRAREPQVTPLARNGRFHSLRTGHDNAAALAALDLGDRITAARRVSASRNPCGQSSRLGISK